MKKEKSVGALKGRGIGIGRRRQSEFELTGYFKGRTLEVEAMKKPGVKTGLSRFQPKRFLRFAFGVAVLKDRFPALHLL